MAGWKDRGTANTRNPYVPHARSTFATIPSLFQPFDFHLRQRCDFSEK